jgi:hypothetical protein
LSSIILSSVFEISKKLNVDGLVKCGGAGGQIQKDFEQLKVGKRYINTWGVI